VPVGTHERCLGKGEHPYPVCLSSLTQHKHGIAPHLAHLLGAEDGAEAGEAERGGQLVVKTALLQHGRVAHLPPGNCGDGGLARLLLGRVVVQGVTRLLVEVMLDSLRRFVISDTLEEHVVPIVRHPDALTAGGCAAEQAVQVAPGQLAHAERAPREPDSQTARVRDGGCCSNRKLRMNTRGVSRWGSRDFRFIIRPTPKMEESKACIK